MNPENTDRGTLARFMLPEGIDPSIFRGNGERPARLAYVAHLLTTEPVRSSGYILLNKQRLRKVITMGAETEAFKILSEFIEIDHSYTPHVRSKGYRWKLPFRDQESVVYNHRCPRFIRKLKALREADRSNYGPIEAGVESDQEKITLDLPDCKGFVSSIPPKEGVVSEIHRKNQLLYSIHQIKSKDMGTITRSSSTGRLYCFMNRVSSLIRPFCQIEGSGVTEIDLASSQPYFLTTLFQSRELIDAVSCGEFYQRINQRLAPPTSLLDPFAYARFKKSTLSVIYARPVHGHQYWNDPDSKSGMILAAMESAYPGISRFLSAYREEHGDRALPNALQKEESGVFVSTILSELQERGIPSIPIHDAIMCKKDQKGIVKELMRRELLKRTGIEPELRG